MRWILLAAFATTALAQGTNPKPKPEDYDAHAQAKKTGIGAEFMVHSFSGHGLTYIAKDYLVVEVALYPPKGNEIAVDPADFLLRLNGRNKPISPQPPSMAAASLQNSEWRTPRGVQATGGIGDVGVILGGPQRPNTPYPTPGSTTRLPPRAPAPDDPSGLDREPPVKADQLLIETALPEGVHRGPVSGFIYFPWQGKVSSLRSVELLFEDTVLKLR